MSISHATPLHVALRPLVMGAGEDLSLAFDAGGAGLLGAGESIQAGSATLTLTRGDGAAAPALPSTRTHGGVSTAQPQLDGAVIRQRVNSLVAGQVYLLTATFQVASSTTLRTMARTIICPKPSPWRRTPLHTLDARTFVAASEDVILSLDAAGRLASGELVDSGAITRTLTSDAGVAVSGLASPTVAGSNIRQRVEPGDLAQGSGYLLSITFGIQNATDKRTMLLSVLCPKLS